MPWTPTIHKMKRRNLLLGLGAAVSGGAATMGTGAFSSAQADRSVSVEVESDNPGAYLALDETDDSAQSGNNQGRFTNLPNGSAAELTGNRIDINLNTLVVPGESATDGNGPATNADTELDGVFEVGNQGTDTVFVNIASIDFGGGDVTVSFYPGEGTVTTDLSSGTAELELPAGETAPIGVRVEAGSDSDNVGGNDKTTTVTATSSSGNPSTTVQNNSGSTGSEGSGNTYNVPEQV
jgi:hypothetical protein